MEDTISIINSVIGGGFIGGYKMPGIIKKIREKHENIKNSQILVKDYVEGKITLETFWKIYISDMFIRNIFYREKEQLTSFYSYFDCKKEQLDNVDLSNIGIRISIFRMCKLYLQIKNIKFIPKSDDEDKYKILSIICPPWLQFDEEFLTSIIQNAPDNLNKANKTAWCRNRIANMFKVEKDYPKWLQNPEWPILNGVPLVFKSQSHTIDNKSTECIKYYFYHPETNEETIVEQFD
ncbi:MAG: hypothetical protein WC075_05355 [Dehalococcoidales bacterium]